MINKIVLKKELQIKMIQFFLNTSVLKMVKIDEDAKN